MTKKYEDIWLKCSCGDDFLFSARDQEFYDGKGYLQPKRCKKCRVIRQQERQRFGQVPKNNY